MKGIKPSNCPSCGEPLEYVDVIKTHHGGCKWNSQQGKYEWNNGEKTSHKCPNCGEEVNIKKLTEDALNNADVLP